MAIRDNAPQKRILDFEQRAGVLDGRAVSYWCSDTRCGWGE
jgi:hypothetical protein